MSKLAAPKADKGDFALGVGLPEIPGPRFLSRSLFSPGIQGLCRVFNLSRTDKLLSKYLVL